MSSTANARLASPSPWVSRTARRRSAPGPIARGRDQLRGHVGELEDRGLGPAAGRFRPPGRGPAEQALVGGDPGVEIAHRDDHVIERVNHAATQSRETSVAGTVREV